MIGDLLQATRQIDSASTICAEAIVLGTGPSFFAAIRRPFPQAKRFGCGIASQHVALDVYALGDEVHWNHAPPGTTVYITQRLRAAYPESTYLVYPEEELPHGGSSGGMALSLACREHDVIGLVGFDGDGMPDDFLAAFRALLTWWKTRGKRLVSLMPASMFDDLLERL